MMQKENEALKNKISFIAVLFLMVVCQGCGNSKMQTEQQEVFASIFEGRENTLVDQEKTVDGVTIIINHAAFEENCMIIDYTMEAEDISSYLDTNIRFVSGRFKNDGGIGITVEESKREVRQIYIYDLEGEELSEKNLGEEVEVEFYSVSGLSKLGYEKKAVFSLKISEVYHPKKIQVAKNIIYEEGSTRIEELILSPFYTKLNVDNAGNDNFINSFYSYELMSEDKSILDWLGGFGDEYIYSPLKGEDQEMGITVIQYSKDGDYDYISETLEVDMR